jgi:hypothetical protein
MVMLATGAVGCTPTTPGVPETAPYQPIAIDSMSAVMAEPVKAALAYSADASMVVGPGDRNRGIGLHRTSAEDDDPGVCPGLPQSAATGQMDFDPSGRTLAVVEDYYSRPAFSGRLWLVDTRDGSVRQVPSPRAGCAATLEQSSSTHGVVDGYSFMSWMTDGTLAAVAPMTAGGRPAECIVRVDPRANPPAVTPVAELDGETANATPEAGGATLVLPVSMADRRGQFLAVVDMAEGNHREIDLAAITGAPATARVPVLAVAPGGSRAVVGGIDLWSMTTLPTLLLDLAGGPPATVPGLTGSMSVGAVFAPDGTQILDVAQAAGGGPGRLTAVQITDGKARTIATIEARLPALLELSWNRDDLVVPRRGSGPLLGLLAPWRLTG